MPPFIDTSKKGDSSKNIHIQTCTWVKQVFTRIVQFKLYSSPHTNNGHRYVGKNYTENCFQLSYNICFRERVSLHYYFSMHIHTKIRFEELGEKEGKWHKIALFFYFLCLPTKITTHSRLNFTHVDEMTISLWRHLVVWCSPFHAWLDFG